MKRAILICLLFNAAACLVMAVWLRPGLDPEIAVLERLRYISEHVWTWRASWLCWIGAALSLIYFFLHWGRFLDPERRSGLVAFGVMVGCLGMVPDTLAETLYLGFLPRLAQEILQAPEASRSALLDSFRHWEWAITLMTGFLGNGFYALGGLALNAASQGSLRFSKKLAALGWPAWFLAFGLSAAAVSLQRDLLIGFTAATMGWFLFWLLILRLTLDEAR